MKELRAHAFAELTEKKSRFLADAYPVYEEAEALARLKEIKKLHYDARHHCSAYRLGDDAAKEHANDDGEPAGTAGRPILSVLQGRELTHVIVIVTRYFGGTLLGTGGLVRAYTQAASMALDAAQIVEKVRAGTLDVDVPYAFVDSVRYLMRTYGITPKEETYAASARYTLIVREAQIEDFTKELQQKTEGKAGITRGETGWFDLES